MFFFCKQKTAYEMLISDWSSDVCSSDLSIMLWNWQLSDWPAFSFDAALLREAEERFLKGAGVVVGSMHHLDGDARQGIVIELISQEMVDSSAIEGVRKCVV